ncbi:MAG: hypothetical protein U1E78_07445 [Gammaproteobacteria bacterium]
MASLLTLVVFVLLGQMLLQITRAQWQDLVLIHDRFQKANAEQSAMNWATAYIKKHHACFSKKTLNFTTDVRKGYQIDLACRQENAQFIISIEKEINASGHQVNSNRKVLKTIF